MDWVVPCEGSPSAPTDAGPGTEAAALGGSVSPNPFRGVARIRFVVPLAAPAEVGIYTVGGRRVRLLRDPAMVPGARQVLWDGLADDGRPAPRGLYFYRISASKLRGTGKLVLVR
jgi:hypothetical protein